ncbi:hypothetical protein U1Q18_028767 [Sarracenia purpurea var. burkii]
MNASERWMREGRDRHHPQRIETPSFSSSLLDAICRSIDESKSAEDDESVLRRETTAMGTRKQRNDNFNRSNAPQDVSLRQAIMIEKWKGNENRKRITRGSTLQNSTSSSSESSCGGVFSSSETESCHFRQARSGGSAKLEFEQTPTREGRLKRPKSKALKIYDDLKKAKQPISPGRRITNFLNSLFNSRNLKNAKHENIEDLNSMRKSRSTTCLLSSSFSRSCLIKPLSSRTSQSTHNGSKSKTSVRFYPVSVTVDEDSRPRGDKCIREDDPSLMPTPNVRKIVETKVLENELQEKNSSQSRDFQDYDEEEDDMSCTSSDLFELENIDAIGEVGAYRGVREELPVYGTTSLKAHLHAIANGLIL